MAAGAQSYLTKPGGIDVIEQTIAGLLSMPAMGTEANGFSN
jgi:hypothetical protein